MKIKYNFTVWNGDYREIWHKIDAKHCFKLIDKANQEGRPWTMLPA